MPALQKKHKKSSVHNIKSVMNTRYGCGGRTRTYDLRVMRADFVVLPCIFTLIIAVKYVVICSIPELFALYRFGSVRGLWPKIDPKFPAAQRHGATLRNRHDKGRLSIREPGCSKELNVANFGDMPEAQAIADRQNRAPRKLLRKRLPGRSLIQYLLYRANM